MAKKALEKRVRAQAKCASFTIDIDAKFYPHGLAAGEVDDIKRKLRQKLADAVASLPFSHVYPCEVRTR